jgi:hypothetical protein
MPTSRRTSRLVLAVAAALAAAIPASASATTRYVAPGGTSAGTCPAAAPCSYTYVFKGAGSQAGDTVLLGAGTYDVGSIGLTIDRPLDVAADPAAATRPKVRTTLNNASAVAVMAGGWGSTIDGLDIEATSTVNGNALAVAGKVAVTDVNLSCGYRCVTESSGNARITLEDSHVKMSGGGTDALELANGGTIRRTSIDVTGGGFAGLIQGQGSLVEDSTVTSDSGGLVIGAGSAADPVVVQRVSVRAAGVAVRSAGRSLVRDSLLVSTGWQGVGLDAFGLGKTTARNVTAIALGAQSTGLLAENDYISQTPGTLDALNSIARGTAADVSGTPAKPSSPASVVHIAYSNFHTYGPSTIDHGHRQSAAPGFVDPTSGDYRLAAGSPAIDAGDAAATGIGPTDLAGAARNQGEAPDLGAFESKPVVKPPVKPPVEPPVKPPVKADHTAPVRSKVKLLRARGGRTRIRFVLSERATVRVVVRRRGLKRAQVRTIRKLSVTGRPGANLKKLRRRIGRPGRYSLTLTAIDPTGNRSLRIVRKLRVAAH